MIALLRRLPLDEFTDKLAGDEPAPGGGSASAAVAAIGASLLVMTCNLTIGRKRYASVEEDMREAMDELEALRVWLLASTDRDSDAYNDVVGAFAMPRVTDEEKAARREAIQTAFRGATEVPLDVARRCARGLRLARMVVELGNPNTATDAGCGARFLEAGLQGALYNVRINLGSLKDEAFVEAAAAEVEELEVAAARDLQEALAVVEQRLVD